VEPPEVSFSHPAELGAFVDVDIRPRFTVDDGWSGYFIAVPPGTYSFYGQMMGNQASAMGICLCMGTVKFEARPGQITYVGEVQGPAEGEGSPIREDRFRLVPALSVTPHSASMPMPERFAGLNVVSAELRAADKTPNVFGVMISRMAPVEGVLGYRRDEVLDLRAQPQAAQTGGN
jgi:hypothetical protein